MELALTGSITVCITPAVWAEYRDVLFRDKFAPLRGRAVDLLSKLEARALFLEPAGAVSVAKDEDDNRFLECAEAAGAAYLITGNLKHYPAEWGSTAVVNARQFLTSSLE